MVLFTIAYLGAIKPFRKDVGPWVNFKVVPWMLRNIPSWARIVWATGALAVMVQMYQTPRKRLQALDGKGGADIRDGGLLLYVERNVDRLGEAA